MGTCANFCEARSALPDGSAQAIDTSSCEASKRPSSRDQCKEPSSTKGSSNSIENAMFESEHGLVSSGLPRQDRQQIGMLCKRLIDYGRLQWLKEQGMQAELVRFVDPSVSGENCLILGRQRCASE